MSVTGAIVTTLLVGKPVSYIPGPLSKEVIDDSQVDNLIIDPRDYEVTGDFEMPSIFDTYHVSGNELKDYSKKGILTVGRKNPMYFKSEEKIDYSAGASYTWEDIESEVELDKGEVLGFDINATPGESQGGGEIKPVEISSIEEKFANYAVYPVDKKYYNFSSHYGPRIDPIKKSAEVFHGGIDIAQVGINGSNIYSVLPGVISHIDYNENGYGNFIVVNHGDFTTLYAHLKEKPVLEVGDEVEAGDKIGIVGTTGRSTGPHLHLEVSKGSILINPKPLLDSIGTGVPAKPQVKSKESSAPKKLDEGKNNPEEMKEGVE